MSQVLSVSADGKLSITEISSGLQVSVLYYELGIISACRHPDKEHIFLGYADRIERQSLTLRRKKKILTIPNQADATPVNMVISDAGDMLAVQFGIAKIKLYRINPGVSKLTTLISDEIVTDAIISKMVFEPGPGGALLVGTTAGFVHKYSTRDGRLLTTLEGHNSSVYDIVGVTSLGCVTTSYDGTARVWETRVGIEAYKTPNIARALYAAIYNRGAGIIYALSAAKLHIFDIRREVELQGIDITITTAIPPKYLFEMSNSFLACTLNGEYKIIAPNTLKEPAKKLPGDELVLLTPY